MSVWPDPLEERPDGPTCGALDCTDPAEAVIDHPKHGERTVCHQSSPEQLPGVRRRH